MSRTVPGVSDAQLVDSVQWIMEVGNRVWIVTVLEQVGSAESLSGHAKSFATGLVISSANPGTATDIGKTRALTHAASEATLAKPEMEHSTAGTATLTPTADTLAWPSWWSGTCNVNNYPPGYLLTTGQGVLSGLEICAPSSSQLGGYVWVPFDGYGARQWQCVELSLRYMDIAWGVHPYAMNDAYTIATDFPSRLILASRRSRTMGLQVSSLSPAM